MSKTFFKLGLGVLVLAGMAWPMAAAVPTTRILPGHVPAVVSQLTAASRLPATTNLYLSIGLPLRNREALTNLLRQICDSSSTNYQHYLTPDEFTAQFGPTPEDYQAVINFASSNGLTVAHTHGNRMLVDVVGKVSNVEKAFHVTMMTYHHPTEMRDFYAPNTEPSVDASLPVLAVQGMNNYVLPHPLLQKKSVSSAQPANGSGPFGGYIGQDFRNAYAPGTALNGANQIVGLLQFDGYNPSDIMAYESLAGLTNVPLQNVLLDGFNGQPGFNNDEVCLDIEMVISMAPALAKVVVFEAGPFGYPDDILNSMASSNQIKQLSASWGYGIDATTEQIYQQFALQGQTYLNASGDGDAWLGPIPYGSCEDANVTLVGGTTLTMSGQGAAYASETAWNWGFAYGYGWNPDGYVGTSGGISTDVGLPIYQQGISMATNGGSTTFRNTPDVALTADNVFVIFSGGSEGIFGGTSCASPLWAGFMALINQQAAANNKPSVGFLAPAVYALAKTASYSTCFHDTTNGDNTWPGSPENFFAVPGYDLCTGLGTPNGTNIINALAGVTYGPIIPAPLAPWGTNLGVMNGSNPNGLWFLFVQDDTPINIGTNYNGWYVTLTTANPVGYAADNQLFINATNVTTTPGLGWTTILAVTNYGPSISSNVVVSDTFPVFPVILTYTNSSIPGSTITFSGSKLNWNISNLPVNAGGTLSLGFLVNSTGVFTNSATVSAFTPDPNTDDNSVAVIANVAVTTPPVIVPNFTPGPGGGFQLTVTNDVGANIIIQASTNLVNWVTVYINLAPFTFTNLDSTNYQMRFYRAVVAP
jgi:subtilase family serine protease